MGCVRLVGVCLVMAVVRGVLRPVGVLVGGLLMAMIPARIWVTASHGPPNSVGMIMLTVATVGLLAGAAITLMIVRRVQHCRRRRAVRLLLALTDGYHPGGSRAPTAGS